MVTHAHSSHKTYVARNGIQIVRKKRSKFVRPLSDRFKRVGEAWRKPRGIDSPTRRRFRGARLMPNRGYGSDKRTRFVDLITGKTDFLVRNARDLEALTTKTAKYQVVFSRTIGGKKRAELLEKAMAMGLYIKHKAAQMTVEEIQ